MNDTTMTPGRRLAAEARAITDLDERAARLAWRNQCLRNLGLATTASRSEAAAASAQAMAQRSLVRRLSAQWPGWQAARGEDA